MRLIRFCLVGALVFLVEALLLTGLVASTGLSASRARAITLPGAIVLAWYLNRRITFRSVSPPSGLELGRYTLNNLGGLLLNVCVYYGMLALLPALQALPVVALSAGSVAGLALNYLGSQHWVFRRQPIP